MDGFPVDFTLYLVCRDLFLEEEVNYLQLSFSKNWAYYWGCNRHSGGTIVSLVSLPVVGGSPPTVSVLFCASRVDIVVPPPFQ